MFSRTIPSIGLTKGMEDNTIGGSRQSWVKYKITCKTAYVTKIQPMAIVESIENRAIMICLKMLTECIWNGQ